VTELQHRPRYYEGQYLDAADLQAAVDYTRTQRARTLLGAHRWGIAIGMDLAEVAGPQGTIDVVVTPGYGWDGFGRPIVVAEPTKLPVGLFGSFDAMLLPGGAVPPPFPVEVWIRYDERLAQPPRPGFETCDTSGSFARVLEGFALEVGSRNDVAARRDPVEVAGRTMDGSRALTTFDAAAPLVVDASIPHQVLPDDVPEHWLLPLGVVTYQPGSPGRLVARDEATLVRHARSREYVGAVAGSVEAPAGLVRVHDRGVPYSPHVTDELLSVEGRLRCDDDVRLYGSRLEFVASHVEDPRQPFHVVRREDLAQGSADLTLVIGDRQQGDNRLVVARKSGEDATGDILEPRMVVTDQGRAGIGVEQPLAPLHVTSEGLQVGDGAPQDNFTVDVGTAPRALRFNSGNAGAATTRMTVTDQGRVGIGAGDPTHPLHVTSAQGLRQGSMYLSGGQGWSSLTYNAHHDAANATWAFPDPTRPAVTVEMDDAGGVPRFQVWTTEPGNNTSWRARFAVRGDNGRVGIGTTVPQATLDVVGDGRFSGELRFAGLAAVGAADRTRVVWGAVGSSGAVDAGSGFTVERPGGAGRYRLVFGSSFVGRPVVLVSRVFGALNANAGTAVNAGETAVVDLVESDGAIIATAGSNGTKVDGGFTFIAIGSR
jgi:hypothetical protein